MSATGMSTMDPSSFDGVREQLVGGFARRIFDATPDVAELIATGVAAHAFPGGQRSIELTAQLLTASRRELQTQISVAMRRNLDAKLLPFLDPGSKSRLSLDGLTLLADERLDEEIAVNQCTRRLKEQCEYELWGLTQRICILTGRDGFADADNPVFPQLFAKSLMDAITALDMPSVTRLAVFRIFGPVLLDIVPDVYKAANAYLTGRGIDVETSSYLGRPVTHTGRPGLIQTNLQEIASGVSSSNQTLAATLKNLIDRTSTQTEARAAASLGASILQFPATRAALPDVESAAPITRGRSRALHEARQMLHDRLNADEQVVTDIVTVMFDRLFVEPRIAPQLQSVIGRLQIPVLEVALRDSSLLTQVQHPVRKLIDLIAEFGLTLELNAGDDSTTHSVANIVDGLLRLHDGEPRAFQLAFDRLDDLFYHHEEAALQRNESVRELERNEATEFAGSRADREIAVRLQNRLLPNAVIHFIVASWRETLVNAYLKAGAKGEPWKMGLAALDDLLKSVSPATPQPEHTRLAASLPPLLAFLQNAPHNAQQDPSVITAFLTELDRIHALGLNGQWATIASERFVPSHGALSTTDFTASPSAELALIGVACGDWIETNDARGRRRWRLNWITSIRGTCVFKHYESNTTRNMSIDQLRASLASGDIERVRGLGLADEVINDAFEVVSRKARRSEIAIPPKPVPGVRSAMTR